MINFFNKILIFFWWYWDAHFFIFWLPLGVFLLFQWRQLKDRVEKDNLLRLLLLFYALMIITRFLLLYVGYPYQRRYFYPILLLEIFPITWGILFIMDYLEKYLGAKWKFCVILVFTLVCIGKILNPPTDRQWLDELPNLIKEHKRAHTTDQNIVLLMAINDVRIPYYASTKEYYLILPPKEASLEPSNNHQMTPEKYQIYERKHYEGQLKWLPILAYGRGFEAIFKAVEVFGRKRTFIIFDYEREQIERYWKEKGITPNIKFIKELKIHTGKIVSLYCGIADNNEKLQQ